ncbi:hypothetical protein [Roseisolibacter agri]|uniref:Uncharacterized protein n=1 Tax=Roseisolibacter agri TaxID=2014610 RepID=A0AA37QFX7_9BACT|nr:hypothetical protein [Roseisolibacter agri]GLC25043.1 hypothetical protein rosag_15560 [Roseisolibacter agri]
MHSHDLRPAVAPAGAHRLSGRSEPPAPTLVSTLTRRALIARAGRELAAEFGMELPRIVRTLPAFPEPRMLFSDAQRRPLTMYTLGQGLAAAALAGAPLEHVLEPGLRLVSWTRTLYGADPVPLADTWAHAARESAESTIASGAVLGARLDLGVIDRAIAEATEAIAANEQLLTQLRVARSAAVNRSQLRLT